MSSTHQPHNPAHDHLACVNYALETAAQLCEQQGLRFTPIRQRVLELVWASHAPIPAYELLKSLRREKPNAEAPTIYRALDFLQQHGMVHKIESMNAFVGCDHPGKAHAGQFLICSRCKQVLEQESMRINRAIAQQALSNNFIITDQTIEIIGLCKECQVPL